MGSEMCIRDRDWLDSTPDSGFPRVVRTLSVDYLRPVHHRGILTGRLWVSRIGHSSFDMQHALGRVAKGFGDVDARVWGHVA